MNAFPRLAVLNRYYRITRFYAFLKNIGIKAGIALLGFVLVFLAIDLFIIDANELFTLISESYSAWIVFSVFFVSEVLMGILPPEIFIVWGLNSVSPWLTIFFLAALSYTTGLFSYLLGRLLYTLPSVQHYIGRKIPRHIVNLRKWGGFFIFVGAVLPLPHSLVSFASGLIKFKLKYYLLWALFRFVRFFVFAVIILKIF